MEATKVKRTEEARIRQQIDDWAKAIRSKDVDRVMICYTADVLSFDLAPPLQYKGADAHRRNWEAWFPTWQGPIGFEMRDLGITVDEDIAFSHSLNRISGTKKDGEKPDVWVRWTACYRKINGRWLITHEHVSVPFYMDGSGKAAVDLEP